MTRTQDSTPTPLTQRSRERRGTIILLALGALAVISIAAIAYVTVVRIDRGSALYTSRDQNFQQQVNIVTDHIGELLAADLFGNKVVSLDTPLSIGGVSNRPAMFEDGEYWDYPYAYVADDGDNGNRYTWDKRERLIENIPTERNARMQAPTSSNVENNLFPARSPAALTDDAWLASTEPDWNLSGYPNIRDSGSLDATYRWPQVTNLRSAYRFVPDDSFRPDQGGAWVRGDGRFVDLARFFESSEADDFGDPGVDFLSLNNGEGRAITPRAGRGDPVNFADQNNARDTTDVFDVQIDELASIDPAGNDAIFLHTDYDERYWVDADGDLRPDSRWTQLDALAGAFGYVWFVGARVIDASSMVNFNASIEGGTFYTGSGAGQVKADGRTPAGIALERLLYDKRPEFTFTGTNGTREVRTDELMPLFGDASFNKHVTRGLRLPNFTDALANAALNPTGGVPPEQGSTPWNEKVTPFLSVNAGLDSEAYDNGDIRWNGFSSSTSLVTTPAQRFQFYALFGGSPTSPINGSVGGYPYRDIIDLHAFWGTNSTAVNARIEQNIDPDDRLPGSAELDDNPTFAAGPLRSIESGEEGRALVSNGIMFANPTPRMLHDSSRRFLTAYSGVSDVSPVPNFRADGTPNRKINLLDLGVDSSANLPSSVHANIFEAMVWALAPLATDQPLSGSLAEQNTTAFADGQDGRSFNAATENSNTPTRALDLHYGGGVAAPGAPPSGEAERFFGPEGGAAYAVTTAGALTANLLDASDEDNVPTILRLIGSSSQDVSDRDETAAIELGLDFDHGSIRIPDSATTHPMNNPLFGLGTPSTSTQFGSAVPEFNTLSGTNNPQGGMTLVGLEQQPFLVEAYALGVYCEDSAFLETINDLHSSGDNRINYDDPDEQLGSFLAFELINPWSETLLGSDLSRYRIVLPQNTGTPLEIHGPDTLRFRLPDDEDMLPGERRIFYWISSENLSTTWQEVRPAIVEAFEQDIESAIDAGRSFPLAQSTTPMDALLPDGITVDPYDSTPVIFQDLNTNEMPVLLMQSVSDTADLNEDGTVTPEDWVLVDRLTPPSGESFPDVLRGTQDIYGPNINDSDLSGLGYDAVTDERISNTPRYATGRVVVASSLSRAANTRASSGATGAPDGGFPSAVIETGNDLSSSGLLGGVLSSVVRRSETELWSTVSGNFWMMPLDVETNFPDPTPADARTEAENPLRVFYDGGDTEDYVGATLNLFGSMPSDRASTLGEDENNADGLITSPTNLPGFQLFVLDAPLKTVADLHMLTKFAHRCSNNELNNLGAWITVGEQIANSLVYDHSAAFGSGTPNPYAATLDPTRYVLTAVGTGYNPGTPGPGNPNAGDLLGVQGLPESMAVPLATRVFDPFTALPPSAYAGDSVAHGVININTAPRQVLETLPLLVPLGDIEGYEQTPATRSILPASPLNTLRGFGSSSETLNAREEPGRENRALLIREYRDREHNRNSMFNINGTSGAASRAEYTGINGLRAGRQDNAFGNGTGERPGIASLGELSILGQWESFDLTAPLNVQPHPVGSSAQNPGMMALADRDLLNASSTRQHNGYPLDLYNSSSLIVPDADNPSALSETDGFGYVVDANDPADDVEERLAIFRAMSNIVSTRSDVYLAWFVLRGYNPRDIESVELSGTNTVDAMQDPVFAPAYETRWLVLYDRSNVRKPTDRPRVLMQVEVPIEQRPE